ncbi:uncharacterized protein BYT42DRAFT_610989 [Radiomyces spectabilis]|uniref:uncharacterized protein n=1 Tax=Radiomyces spectabilis TaxID=64574 RepID=UPI002221119F|nr:uncharacterized protein BYT42DRAFT_610989 [Radiomyces spectabilis]KAI8391803.1 hypothetical protein BYT42DRAFT_610989 [Radiomyces spectabilis]
MTFTYGYELESGHVVVPPLLAKKITVSSAANTNRWVFFGTREEILQWMREHNDIQLENSLFASGRPVSFQTHTEIVIDLQYFYDAEQSYYNYFRSFFTSDYSVERVKVEIRPRVDSKDHIISALSRVIVASGSKLGEIVDELEREWNKPAASYYQQAINTFSDDPVPSHIISTDAPMTVQVSADQVSPQASPNPLQGHA